MSALRILHVAPYFENAWAYGGIPRVVAAQAHALAAAGHRVTVATTDVRDGDGRTVAPGSAKSPRAAYRTERTADGIEVRVCPNVSNTIAYRWQLYLPRGFSRAVRDGAREFDVAHLHACHNLLTSVAATYLRRAGIPYVVQPNGTARRIERRRVGKLIFDALFDRGTLPHAARIVAVTAHEQRQLRQLTGEADARKVRLIPNPLAPLPQPPLPERAAFRERHHLSDAPVLMYLGMLSPRKQPEMLARAAAELGRRDAQLVFAGNDMGAERSTRDAVRRLGLQPRTRFTGLLEGPARYEALAAADVFVYPSSDEVFGLAPLDALQSGTPVVVSNDSGCGEIVGAIGGGLLVPPGDAQALARAIETMLGDLPRWREAAVRAAAEAGRRFHPAAVAIGLEEVYRDAIARPGTA
jgi:glycosyltransferase involved in cell wall biosynthesis